MKKMADYLSDPHSAEFAKTFIKRQPKLGPTYSSDANTNVMEHLNCGV